MPTPLTIALTPGYVWTVGETVTEAKLNLAASPTVDLYGTVSSTSISDNAVTTAKIQDGAVTAAKLAATLDLSGKTLTLPAASVTYAALDTDFIVDATAKTTPIAADLLLIADTAASNATKKSTILQVFLAGLTDRVNTGTAAIPATAGLATIAHGLAAVPFLYKAFLICTDAGGDAGYAQNNEVPLESIIADAGATALGLYADSTNVYARRLSSGSIYVLHKTTGASTAVDTAKWQVKIYAL